MNKSKIKIAGHIGTWSAIEEVIYKGKTIYLMEHDFYGDEAAMLIIDEDNNIVADEIWNGFDDLEYLEEV